MVFASCVGKMWGINTSVSHVWDILRQRLALAWKLSSSIPYWLPLQLERATKSSYLSSLLRLGPSVIIVVVAFESGDIGKCAGLVVITKCLSEEEGEGERRCTCYTSRLCKVVFHTHGDGEQGVECPRSRRKCTRSNIRTKCWKLMWLCLTSIGEGKVHPS